MGRGVIHMYQRRRFTVPTVQRHDHDVALVARPIRGTFPTVL
jgi:hypothetical protein